MAGTIKQHQNMASFAKTITLADAKEHENAPQQDLRFNVNLTNFPALSAAAQASALFQACDEAFVWGAKNAPNSPEDPPQVSGTWTKAEDELIRAAAREGAATKNAGSTGFTQAQQIEFAQIYGLAIAQALEHSLSGAPSSPPMGATVDPVLNEKLIAIYVAAYAVYGNADFSGAGEGEGDQQTASNLGRNLLIGIGIAALLAGGLYLMSKKEAKANPNEMRLYQLNDEQESITLEEFLSANQELDADDVEKIKSLKVEETFHGGGGAQPEWKIRRVY